MDVSNPDRIVFPATGHTKGDVVAHYTAVAELMMPFVAGSPLTLQRFPKGLSGAGFMQKNAPAHYPADIERLEVPRRDGEVTTYPVVRHAHSLPYLANQGTLTFHVWTSRLPDLATPHWLVMDLDPEEGDIAAAMQLTRETGDVLSSFGLSSFVVATGSKGYHIWAPLLPEHQFAAVGRTTRALAGILATYFPELATTEFLKKDRGGKVFVDWLRNQQSASIVAPYSLRPRPNAPVAMPISWDELADTPPDRWTIDSVAQRLDRPFRYPEPSRLDTAAIEGEAVAMGVDLDVRFDRFGRS